MNSIAFSGRVATRAAGLIGAVSLSVALAAVPVAGGACDMNAVDQQLARMAQDTPRTVATNAANPTPPSAGGNVVSAGTSKGGQAGDAPDPGAMSPQKQ